MIDNTKLGFFDRFVPGYKQMWELGNRQNWKCFDCNVSIANDPEWVSHLGEGIATCERCGKKRWGNKILDFKE